MKSQTMIIRVLDDETKEANIVLVTITAIGGRAVVDANWREEPTAKQIEAFGRLVPEIGKRMMGMELEVTRTVNVADHKDAAVAARRYLGGGMG